jgi:hypothetical protein
VWEGGGRGEGGCEGEKSGTKKKILSKSLLVRARKGMKYLTKCQLSFFINLNILIFEFF